MATTRVISVDLRTGTRIAELEITRLRYGRRRNAYAPLSGQLPLPELVTTADWGRAASLNDAVDECRRHLIVERDGVIVGDGIVWESPTRSNGTVRDLRCYSTWSYFARRLITSRSVFTAADQLTIVRSLVNAAQAKTGGNIGVTVGTETCGVLRDCTYEAFELKNMGEAIEQLAAVEDGFDFAIDCSWDPSTGALVKRLNLHYPRRGRTFAQTGHVFELGRNMTDFEWPSSGRDTANSIWGLGAGEGDSMLRTNAVDAYQFQALSSGGPGFPLLEDVFTNKDESVSATLSAQARARLTTRSKPVVIPRITVRADMDPVLGAYIEGDACRLIIPPGTTPRFPEGLDTFRRIAGWDVEVDDEGTESVVLILEEEPVV